jgi:hypothetical protein
MKIVLFIGLVTLAHVIRDGWPDLRALTAGKLGTTAARAFATLICAFAGALIGGLIGTLLGLSIGIGFWADQKHGEGQEARGWRDAMWLSVSGLTSLAPPALASGVLIDPWCALIGFAGLFKPAIWFSAWRLVPARLYPTRVAAGVFGFAAAVVVYIVLDLVGLQ